MNKIISPSRHFFLLWIIYVISLTCHAQSASGRGLMLSSEPLFQELHRGQFIENHQLTAKNIKVLDSMAAYQKVLTDYSREPAKAVDFSKGRVVLVGMGQQMTGGYQVQVASVEAHSSHVVVKIQLIVPSSECMLIEALTHPYQFVYVTSNKQIVVQEALLVSDCR